MIEGGAIIRNHEMLNQVQDDNGGEFSVTLNLFQGLMNTYTSVFDYGLWVERRVDILNPL
jgi:hypothetical protein